MKWILSIFILMGSTILTYSQAEICHTEWIEANGKKYQAPESVKLLKITFIDNMDGITLATKNHTSKYIHKSFLDVKGRLGISYGDVRGDIIDIFKDGTLIVWRNKIPTLKAHCPTLKLNIKKH